MTIRRICFFLTAAVCVVMLAACDNTKYLPANDPLYTGATIKIRSRHMSHKQKKTLTTELKTLVRPRPNKTILGLRPKLWFWNIAGTPKHKISIRRLIKKLGEPPVLLSDVNTGKTSKVLQNYLENNGYFRSEVTGDISIKKKRAHATYSARPGPQYTINQVVFQQDSSPLQKAITRIARRTLLKKGQPFSLELIKTERTRIDSRLKQRGFYFFDPNDIIMDVDSTIGNHLVNIYVNTKQSTPPEARKIYHINDVVIYSRYNSSVTFPDTIRAFGRKYHDYIVVDSSNFYKPRLFQQAMQFKPGDRYNRGEHNATLNRLINLGIFKFVKNRFQPVKDSMLDAYYYLTPLPKNSLHVEVGATNKSNNLTGSQVTVGFTNRNAFRGGEILNVNVTGGSEVQVSGNYKGYNTYRYGAEVNLNIPRFVVPFVYVNPRGGFVPRTNIQLGYDVLSKQSLYTLTSVRGQYGYIWKETERKEHSFYPISIQYVQPRNVSQSYRDSIRAFPALRHVIDTQFILGANYSYLFNQLVGRVPDNAFYFNGLVDVSGNIAGLVKKSVIKAGDTARLFGAPFSQYAKLETDFRYYRNLGGKNVWANRIDIGVGIPYGNSKQLPFIKQFFVGGNNSLRAFRSRALGPGTYIDPDLLNTDKKPAFIPDESGDIKMEVNSELRFKIFSPLYGAAFVDAGNIWLYNEDASRPGSKFTNDFLKEFAVGTGLGLRVDISILILRLDLAFPIRKPWLPESERWVIDQIRFGDRQWRKENLVWNLAIGYPF